MGNDIRIHFTIGEPGRFISHLDVLRTMERAISRSKLPIAYSEGFHPKQKLTFAAPLPVGVTSDVEYADLQMSTFIAAAEVKDNLNQVLPAGFQVVESANLPAQYQALMGIIAASRYQITIINDEIILADLASELVALLSKPELLVTVRRKKGDQIKDIKPLIYDLGFDQDSSQILLECASGSQANLRPMDILQLLDLSLGDVTIHRTALYVRNQNKELVTPFAVIKE